MLRFPLLALFFTHPNINKLSSQPNINKLSTIHHINVHTHLVERQTEHTHTQLVLVRKHVIVLR